MKFISCPKKNGKDIKSRCNCLRPSELTTGEPPHLIILKGYISAGFAERVYHIHVRYSGVWNGLIFQDYLIAHPDTTAEYAALKWALTKRFEHARYGYTEAKTLFIKAVTKKARQ